MSRLRAMIVAAACAVAFGTVATAVPAHAAPLHVSGCVHGFCRYYRGSFPTLDDCVARADVLLANTPDGYYECDYVAATDKWDLYTGDLL